MKKVSKNYKAALAKVDTTKVYEIAEASKLVKETSTNKFDASVDLCFRLNVNPTKAEQLIRGTISLPHGNGKTKKVLVVTNTKLEDAKASGADYYGGLDMLEKIKTENWFDFDIIVATPDMMGELGKMGRLLGPKGLMPNPKTGTVTMDVKTAVSEIKKGKIAYRVDKDGNLAMGVGRVSFSESDLSDNILAVCNQIAASRPSTVKGTYIQKVVISTTMGPAIKITFASRS